MGTPLRSPGSPQTSHAVVLASGPNSCLSQCCKPALSWSCHSPRVHLLAFCKQALSHFFPEFCSSLYPHMVLRLKNSRINKNSWTFFFSFNLHILEATGAQVVPHTGHRSPPHGFPCPPACRVSFEYFVPLPRLHGGPPTAVIASAKTLCSPGWSCSAELFQSHGSCYHLHNNLLKKVPEFEAAL